MKFSDIIKAGVSVVGLGVAGIILYKHFLTGDLTTFLPIVLAVAGVLAFLDHKANEE